MKYPTVTKVTRYRVYDPITGLNKEYALSMDNEIAMSMIMAYFIKFYDRNNAFPDCWHDLCDILAEYLEKEQ